MDTKIIILLVVSIFAFAPEFTTATIPAFCNQLPTPGFPGDNVDKWAFNHKQNKCTKLTWSGDTKVHNFFDSEEMCLKTCRPVESTSSKPYTLVSGVCVCRCPKCDYHAFVPGNHAFTTAAPKSTAELTTTTTESSLMKKYFGF